MQFAEVKDGVVLGIYCAKEVPQGFIPLPDCHELCPGMNIGEMSEDGTLKPFVERVIQGYAPVPDGMKINESRTAIVEKTDKDKFDSGELLLSTGIVIDAETEMCRPMKLVELHESGLLSLLEYIDKYIRPQRDRLLDSCDIKYCNSDRWEKYTSAQKEEWREYKKYLKDVTSIVSEVRDVILSWFIAIPSGY